MTAIGVFTPIGNKEFSNFLQSLKKNGATPVPTHILDQYPFSTTLKPEIEIEHTTFTTRYELGVYLGSLFESTPRDTLMKNEGLWNWLSLFYIDQIIPSNLNGIRRAGEIARYIYNPHYSRFYRHLVAASWDIYRQFGENSKLFLLTPMDKSNKFITELAARQNIISNKNLIQAVQMLYWKKTDDGREGVKKGAYNRKKQGNLFRFIAVMNQFDTNYDLYAMKPNDILKILPAEFDIWKPQRETRRRSLIPRITQ